MNAAEVTKQRLRDILKNAPTTELEEWLAAVVPQQPTESAIRVLKRIYKLGPPAFFMTYVAPEGDEFRHLNLRRVFGAFFLNEHHAAESWSVLWEDGCITADLYNAGLGLNVLVRDDWEWPLGKCVGPHM